MRNKYQARCFVCQRLVHVGEGETNMFNGQWLTRHADDPNCVRVAQRPQETQQHMYYKSVEEELSDAELMEMCSASDFEDLMGIGWER